MQIFFIYSRFPRGQVVRRLLISSNAEVPVVQKREGILREKNEDITVFVAHTAKVISQILHVSVYGL